MPAFTIEEVASRHELDAIAECMWAVGAQDDIAHHLFYPVITTPEAALEECKERLWKEHTSDPSSHWIFVRDHSSATLRVMGSCQWRFYEQNPFQDGLPQLEAAWWPTGDRRAFATSFMQQVMAPRLEWMARPHAGLSWCGVRHECQRKGIGRALMAWGLERADKLGLESFIEASDEGRELYEHCGHGRVALIQLKMDCDEKTDEWKALEHRYMPYDFHIVWRPIRGEWAADEPKATWDKRIVANEARLYGQPQEYR